MREMRGGQPPSILEILLGQRALACKGFEVGEPIVFRLQAVRRKRGDGRYDCRAKGIRLFMLFRKRRMGERFNRRPGA